jgi:hypothetical protein
VAKRRRRFEVHWRWAGGRGETRWRLHSERLHYRSKNARIMQECNNNARMLRKWSYIIVGLIEECSHMVTSLWSRTLDHRIFASRFTVRNGSYGRHNLYCLSVYRFRVS